MEMKFKNELVIDNLSGSDLVCFSHLRWNFVYQRPQHLLSRFAKHCRVFFIEEPIFGSETERLEVNEKNNVWVVVPHFPHDLSHEIVLDKQKKMLAGFFEMMEITQFISWYYTPMALPFTEDLTPALTVYDCMDELSAFKFAPSILTHLEKELLNKADVVFTGGQSIYEAKKHLHKNIHAFPSSIDKEHFGQARNIKEDPADQASIPHPRFGFFGVLDERFDADMIREVAAARPNWQFVLIGPVVKIDPASLPQANNIHYLGGKSYDELPHYLAGWDIAMIPFAINESTKFISPTKTPEYLAAGKPVISTPIRDVVKPYGVENIVHIAHTAEAFIAHAEQELSQTNKKLWLRRVDNFLADISWDITWEKMAALLEKGLVGKQDEVTTKTVKAYV
ncbi:MAG: glycosyltransferase family 1 protein [Chitinophagaceae bacterium]|nr:glycosyltransferase family 1 protein [Chitinophagaceae bacterium]